MATTFNSSVMTSEPAKAVHAGLNAVTVQHQFSATLSGSVLLNLCKLPKGATPVSAGLWTDAAAQGDAADTYAILDNEGNKWLQSAVPATTDVGVLSIEKGCGARITGSAHAYLDINAKATTGTSALTIRATLLYLAEKEGD